MTLKVYGECLYDNIILFAPTVETFSSISFENLNEFVQDGGNILVAANRDVSDAVRDLVESFGVAFDKKGTEVIDHFENDATLDSR